ncbi:MAG: 6-carboxytetrahydropterin synthase [Cyanobacteria bacterium HKST-UBA06]|nr:6-carboxytetrahydropterin synthase [Cyanobacteria bacterium HKST-UBA06]MCA9841143.1 6-carboxytetrahydropterin synthase [Cyanobacteria bacterium HKST-UBA03]
MPVTVELTKQVSFSASHYYWLDGLSEAENWQRFEGCANRHGHGHNYTVEVTVAGPIDPKSGFIINFADLDTLLHQHVLCHLDHKHLNEEVPFFESRLPTLESITVFVAQQLRAPLAQIGLSLKRLKTIENPRLFMLYSDPMSDNPQDPPTLALTRVYTFSAAHQLWNPELDEAENLRLFGPCTRLHGHNYTLHVTVCGPPNPQTAMVADIRTVDNVVQRVILDAVDHRCLERDVAFLAGQLSTAEQVVQAFAHQLAPAIAEACAPARLKALRLFENDAHWVDVDVEALLQDTPLKNTAASTTQKPVVSHA